MPLRESREKAGKVQICEPGYLPVLCDQKLPFKALTQSAVSEMYWERSVSLRINAGFLLSWTSRLNLFYVLWRYTNEKENKMVGSAACRNHVNGTNNCIVPAFSQIFLQWHFRIDSLLTVTSSLRLFLIPSLSLFIKKITCFV